MLEDPLLLDALGTLGFAIATVVAASGGGTGMAIGALNAATGCEVAWRGADAGYTAFCAEAVRGDTANWTDGGAAFATVGEAGLDGDDEATEGVSNGAGATTDCGIVGGIDWGTDCDADCDTGWGKG